MIIAITWDLLTSRREGKLIGRFFFFAVEFVVDFLVHLEVFFILREGLKLGS